MKEIIICEKEKDKIKLSDVEDYKPIFAKKNGCLCGLVVKEDLGSGWILRIGGNAGATGHHETRRGCLESCLKHDYTFFVE